MNHNSHDLPNRAAIVQEKILSKLTSVEGVNCATLVSPEGFAIERTALGLDLTKIIILFDKLPDDKMLTVIGEEGTLVGYKINSGHILAIQCTQGCNLGKIRIALEEAGNDLAKSI